MDDVALFWNNPIVTLAVGLLIGALILPFSKKIAGNLADRVLSPRKDEYLEKRKQLLTVKRDESKKEIEILEKIREAVCAHRGAAVGLIRSMRSSTHHNILSDPKVAGDFNHLSKTFAALHNTAFKVSRSYIPSNIYETTETFWTLSCDQLTGADRPTNGDEEASILNSAAQVCELIDQRITTLRTEC
jgi:hypothetical protein